MKRFVFIFAISVLSNFAFAHELGLEPYLKMQESLANDDFKQALVSHKLICEKELIHYTDDYKDCKKPFKNIDELRSSFKALSEVYIANGAKDELKNVEKATCPMAKAKWLQRKGDLKNPYYGKSMLECGEKI
jgi:hypothetical protein